MTNSTNTPIRRLVTGLVAALAATALMGSIAATDAAAQAPPPPPPPAEAPDGCTWSPDTFERANFKPACDAHDICYSRGSTTDRAACDARLRDDIHAECQRVYGAPEPDPPGPRGPSGPAGICHSRADTYHDVVRAVAGGAYEGSGNPA